MEDVESFLNHSQMDHQEQRGNSLHSRLRDLPSPSTGKAGLQPMAPADGGYQGKNANSGPNAHTGIIAQPARKQHHTTPRPAPYHLADGGFANPNDKLARAGDVAQVPHVAQRSFILYHPYFHCLQLFFRQTYGADIIYDLAATAFSTHTELFGIHGADEALKKSNKDGHSIFVNGFWPHYNTLIPWLHP